MKLKPVASRFVVWFTYMAKMTAALSFLSTRPTSGKRALLVPLCFNFLPVNTVGELMRAFTS